MLYQLSVIMREIINMIKDFKKQMNVFHALT